jgi:hypothetical protein
LHKLVIVTLATSALDDWLQKQLKSSQSDCEYPLHKDYLLALYKQYKENGTDISEKSVATATLAT